MQTSNTNEIKVTIVRMGRDEQQVAMLEEGATVADAFEAVGMNFEDVSRDVYCEGQKAEGSYPVDNGDVLSIVASKVEAGKVSRLYI